MTNLRRPQWVAVGDDGQVHEKRSRTSRAAWLVSLVSLTCLAILAWGGYARHWAWTGLSTQVKLWDWLEALALPVTVALIPLFLTHRHRLGRGHKAVGTLVLAAFAALVLAGYLVPWEWTGFTGNTLWDWLSLALLPVVIATSSLWRPPERVTPEAWIIAGLSALLALTLVAAGYLVPWKWTGFTGNTAWDWFQLLLIPVLLPIVVLPGLLERGEAWLAQQGPRHDPAQERPRASSPPTSTRPDS